ncbi:metal ABC transporter solute-binding protein, Zn/Mn family [Mycolicibacterium thermoresistibile]
MSLAACSGTENRTAAIGDCPTAPVTVVVSVNQWGDIVSQLGGDCTAVTTVLADSSIDPHHFEPAPAEAALFGDAQLVVVNGGHYDEWAARLAATSAPDAPVVDVLAISGGHTHHGHDHDHDHDHDHEVNPHAWYNPAAVTGAADAVTAELIRLAPDATKYFEQRRAEFSDSLQPYSERIATIRSQAAGRSYAATESAFDDMAAAAGLVNRTPDGYRVAAANESEPAPADLDEFLRLLDARGVDVLIFNSQTHGSVTDQIRTAAERAQIPVVAVTETVPPDAESFQTWQVAQLDHLARSLGVER